MSLDSDAVTHVCLHFYYYVRFNPTIIVSLFTLNNSQMTFKTCENKSKNTTNVYNYTLNHNDTLVSITYIVLKDKFTTELITRDRLSIDKLYNYTRICLLFTFNPTITVL